MVSTMCPDCFKKVLKIALPLAFWLAAWQFLAMAVGLEMLLPTPLAVFRRLAVLSATSKFWLSALFSLLRIFVGLLGGTLLGTGLAFLTHFCRWADLLISPAVRVLRATPVVSFILLVYLWISRSNIPGLIAGLMVLPVIWGSLTGGLSSVDGQLLEMARAYRFSSFKTLRLIYLPSLRPHFVSGFLTAFGLAWKSGIAAEVICPPKYAIGTQLKHARDAIEAPDLFAWTLVIIVLSLLLEAVLRRILKKKEAQA